METDIRRAVEKALYILRRYRIQLKNLHLDLIDHPQPELSDGDRCNLPGAPTGVKAAKRADIKKRSALLSSRIEKIENSIFGLTNENRALIEFRYILYKQNNNIFVMDYLSINQAQYYIRRKEILKMLAEMLWSREIYVFVDDKLQR